jgi:hypothetical protein
MYVAVMLFEGWGLHLSTAPYHVEGHPFHAANNINGVGIDSIRDYQVLPLHPRVQSLQESYTRHIVETVHNLPNLLWEVANESCGGGTVDLEFAAFLGLEEVPDWGDSTAWQYSVIDTVKRCEQEMGYDRHPIGMTMQFPVPDQSRVNEPLLAGRAEWISPGFEEPGWFPGNPDMATSGWYSDPPPADGRKIVIADTDHFAPGGGTRCGRGRRSFAATTRSSWTSGSSPGLIRRTRQRAAPWPSTRSSLPGSRWATPSGMPSACG